MFVETAASCGGHRSDDADFGQDRMEYWLMASSMGIQQSRMKCIGGMMGT